MTADTDDLTVRVARAIYVLRPDGFWERIRSTSNEEPTQGNDQLFVPDSWEDATESSRIDCRNYAKAAIAECQTDFQAGIFAGLEAAAGYHEKLIEILKTKDGLAAKIHIDVHELAINDLRKVTAKDIVEKAIAESQDPASQESD